MITADPNQLRYGAHRFAAAAQELQRQSLQLEQTTTSVRQGSDGWSGAGSQSFLLRGERLAADVKKASSAFESVAHTLSRFAMRMEQVLELRRRADQLDQQAFEYGDDSLDSIHTRQHLRHQAAQLRHQADAEASIADSQASAEFQMIAKMIPPTLVPGADAVSPLLEGLPKHWQEYYSRHPELLEEETGAPTLTADQIEANRRSDAMTILIEYHKQSQSLWLSDEDRTEAARVFCEQSYSKLTADDLENEISRISAEEERNRLWQDQIQNGAHGKELIQQEGYTEYAMKQYYQDGAFLSMAAVITASGGQFKRSPSINEAKTHSVVTSPIERVKELRSQLPKPLRKSGNFGYAEVDIQGLHKKEYFAHSSVNKESDKGALPGISVKPLEEPVFQAKKVDPDNARTDTPEAYLRDYDTEYKILNDIASQLGDNKHAQGTINLFTERLTCQSCTDVIMDFRSRYPNITLNILTNDGKVIK